MNLGLFNHFFSLYLVCPSILLLGLYFTWRLGLIQVSKLKMSLLTLFQKEDAREKVKAEGDISHYQAVSSVLASNFGTGNISGMAIALATGGPGSLVWMWIMTFFGAAIQYASCLLGVKYRRKNESGEFTGGPMFYLADGLGFKRLAVIFSMIVLISSFVAGNFTQVNSMILPLKHYGISQLMGGIIMAFFVGIVILGGAKRVANVSSAVVPIMAAIYLGASFTILGIYSNNLLPAIIEMLRSSVGFGPAAGGAIGFTVMKALTSGFDRAIFATDAGTGTVPMLQAGAKTKNPVIDGVVALLPPFLVMIVCTVTALVLMVTGAYHSGFASTDMVTYAFAQGIGGKVGPLVVVLSLLLFGYTTTIAWATCLERAVMFLFGRKPVKLFFIFYILAVPVGAVLKVDLVWIMADIALTAMLVLNVIGIAGLSKEVIADTRAYFSPQLGMGHDQAATLSITDSSD